MTDTAPHVFAIYEAWIDKMTSMHEPDFGWDLVGYVESEEEAARIVDASGCFTEDQLKYVHGCKPYRSADGSVPKMSWEILPRFVMNS